VANSSTVASSGQILASQYNNLRADVLDPSTGHAHSGADSKSVLLTNILNNQFGDGSDGNVTISTNTTLTRTMYYNTLTVNNGVTLITAGYAVFVKGTLTNNGVISNDGTAASGATDGVGGAGFIDGVTGLGRAFGAGGGSNGQQLNHSIGNVGGSGNNGAAPTVFADGAVLPLAPTFVRFPPSSGGGKGGAGLMGTYQGYGGGGGVVGIAAYNLVNTSGTIRAIGGNSTYGGGGGGGGLILYYRTASWGTESVAGGTGYASGGTGTIYKIAV